MAADGLQIVYDFEAVRFYPKLSTLLSRHDYLFVTWDAEFTQKALQPHLFAPIAKVYALRHILQFIQWHQNPIFGKTTLLTIYT